MSIDAPMHAAATAESGSIYNYRAFNFDMETDELRRWSEQGPQVGQHAPEFVLADLDGKAVRLRDFRGRPVVLEFGSYTCPIFSDRVPAMERLAREHPEAIFLVIYVREAHPGEQQGAHRSLAEKRTAAHKLALEEALERHVLVDSLDGAVHHLYGSAWNPVYVIGPDGQVVMRQAWNHPHEVAATLDALRRGVGPRIAESTDMLREPGRKPTGQRLLERGGVRALEDFYRSAPPPVQDSLRKSPSAEVRAAIARFDAVEVAIVRSQDGTPIALWKTGSGPSLLVVHGTAADHTAWDAVVPLLADRFTIYAMDRRGRGASGDAAGYAIEREVEDVLAAVETLPSPVYVYGHSFGGSVAVEAARRSRRVDRLVLYEGGPKPAGLRFIPDDFIARLEQLIDTGQRDEAISTFMLNAAGVATGELEVLRSQSSWPARVAAAHTVPRELRAFNDYAANMERMRTISVPVLLVVGENTEPRRKEMFEQLASMFAQARIVVLPGQRHAAHQTAPHLLASVLREFLLDD